MTIEADQVQFEMTTKIKQLDEELVYQRNENEKMKEETEQYRRQVADYEDSNAELER